MRVTVRRYSGSPELADALAAREDDVRQIITAIDGFRAYYLVRGADGEATSISVFDDAAGGEESSRRAAARLRENLQELSVAPPQVTEGEAVVAFLRVGEPRAGGAPDAAHGTAALQRSSRESRRSLSVRPFVWQAGQ